MKQVANKPPHLEAAEMPVSQKLSDVSLQMFEA